MNETEIRADVQERAAGQILPPEDLVRPWEEVEAGRYMPRRIRGSFRGRPLG